MTSQTLSDLEKEIASACLTTERPPGPPPPWLTGVLAASGNPLEVWDRSAGAFVFDAGQWAAYGHALLRRGRMADAEAAYLKIEACGRTDVSANALGRLYSLLEDWPAALRCWFRGMEHSRSDEQRLAFLRRRGETYSRLGGMEDALVDFMQLRNARPDRLDGHYGVVRILCELRAFEAASDAVRVASALSELDRFRLEILMVRSTGGRHQLLDLARRLANLSVSVESRAELIQNLLHNRATYFSPQDLQIVEAIGVKLGVPISLPGIAEDDGRTDLKTLATLDQALSNLTATDFDAILLRAKRAKILIQLNRTDEAGAVASDLTADVAAWPTTPAAVAEITEWALVQAGHSRQAETSYWRRRSRHRAADRRHELTLVSDAPLLGSTIVFSQIRNEQINLPHFLQHHRRMGASGFVIVDNDSSDASAAYLADQPDVRLYATSCSYRRAGAGVEWLDPIARSSEFSDRLCLRLDADERLVIPHGDERTLDELCAYMLSRDDRILRGAMVDLYPTTLTELSTAESHFAACRYFDADFRQRPGVLAPYFEITGGVRTRTLSGKRQTIGKAPGILGGGRTERLGSHRTSPGAVSDVICAILHYKFHPGFFQKAIQEETRREYAQNGLEWARYSELSATSDQPLICENSRVYTSWRDLAEFGWIESSVGWDNWR